MRIPVLVLLLLGCLIGLAGCPADTPEESEAAAALYQQSLRHSDYFTRLTANSERYMFAQARQLHAGLTSSEQEGNLPYGQQDLPELEAVTSGNAIWLRAGEAATGELVRLKCFELPSDSGGSLSLVNTTEIAAGVQYEYRVSEPVMALTIRITNVRNAAWEISREIMLSGLENSYMLPTESTNWLLEYDKGYQAIIPLMSLAIPDSQAEDIDDQRVAQYPQELLAPLFILSGNDHALIGSVSDEHPLLLDRVYQLSLEAGSPDAGIARVRLEPRYWKAADSSYGNADVASGITLRDQFALAYATGLPQTTAQDGISSAALAEFAARVTYAFQFTPLMVDPRQYGSVLQVHEWIKDPQELHEFIPHVADHWNVSAVVDDVRIIADPAGEVTAAAATSPDTFTTLDCEQYASVLSNHQLLSIPEDMLPGSAAREWIGARQDGVINLLPDNPNALAYAAEYALYRAQEDIRRIVLGSPVSAAAGDEECMALRNVTVLHFLHKLPAESRQELAGRNLLRWCTPTGGQLQLLELAAADGGQDQQRLLVDLYALTFGITPVLSVPRGTLAELLMRLTPRVSGVEYHAGLVDYPGFAATTANLAQLIPESDGYGIALKSPGDMPETGMVAYFPADLKPADAAVFMFIGMDGAVQVVNSNRIRVSSGEQSWEQEIPYGIWVTDHPEPANVHAGDAVIITRKLIRAPAGAGGGTSG